MGMNSCQSGRMVDISAKEEAPKVLAVLSRLRSFVCHVKTVIFFPIGIIAYVNSIFNILFVSLFLRNMRSGLLADVEICH